MACVGAGMIATGLALVATSGRSVRADVGGYDPYYGPGGVTITASVANNGKRYGGITLAGGGAALAIWGLSKR